MTEKICVMCKFCYFEDIFICDLKNIPVKKTDVCSKFARKRFTSDVGRISFGILDNDTPLEGYKVVDLLNQLYEERNYFEHRKEEFLSKWSVAHTENIQLRQELDNIKNLINDGIKHQKTELGQKALKKVIEEHNKWLIGK